MNNKAYIVWGMHGGYGLNGQKETAKAIRKMAKSARKWPQTVFTMEFEPYALDRMVNGARLKMETAVKGVKYKDPASVRVFKKLADQGRLQMTSTYTQPYLFHCDEESVVHQFGEAKRIIKETLGLEMDSYNVQEPCWCGQLPGILKQFNMPYCYFSNAWTFLGTSPLRNAEKVRWRGPDGTEVWTVPKTPYSTPWKEEVTYGREVQSHWSRGDEPAAYQLKWADQAGIKVRVFESLASDFFDSRAMVPYEKADKAIDLECVTIPQIMQKLRDDGVWLDAYREFKEQLCWGLKGGTSMLSAQSAANRAALFDRLSAMMGKRDSEKARTMWELAMLSEHHDMLVLPGDYWNHPQFGVTYIQVPDTCNAESKTVFAGASKAPKGNRFIVLNPTQLRRKEWTRIELNPAQGALKGQKFEVTDAVSRLSVKSRFKDGSVKTLAGSFLADVEPFGTHDYKLSAAAEKSPDVLPLTMKTGNGTLEVTNRSVTVKLSKDRVEMKRHGYSVLKNIRLAARVNGKHETSRFDRIGGTRSADGRLIAWVSGRIGVIPVKMCFEFAPWSRRTDIRVECTVKKGQRMDGVRCDDRVGPLRIVLEHGRPSVYRVHQPFELRKPDDSESNAVQFFVTEWRDIGAGFVTVLDRPSGVKLDKLEASVVLCHAGQYDPGSSIENGGKTDATCGKFSYRIGILPFDPHELPDALKEYQKVSYPLQVCAQTKAKLGIRFEGHSIVSGLCPGPKGTILVRVWNPLAADRFIVHAPGYSIARSRFDGTIESGWTRDRKTIRLDSMQFTQFVLKKTRVRL